MSFDEMDKLSVRDFNTLMKAVEIRQVDQLNRIHLQAFQNFRAKAKKKAGKGKLKPVYSTYKKFFDYEKELNKAMHKKGKSKFNELKNKLQRKEKNYE